MTYTKQVNGVRVELTQKEIEERQAEELAEQEKQLLYERTEKYKDDRLLEYPSIGDQLDAILKQLDYMRLNNETDLVQDADNIVDKWLAVKAKYPKPETK